MKLRLSALALGTTLLVGCASSGTEQQGRSDPFEGFNRTMYNFNFNVLDPYVVRPVAVAWRDYVPQPARNGLSNFTGNLEEPAIMVNYFLQGDPYQGMVHFTRFFLNTLLGMGGFIDVAGMANPKLQRVEPHRFGSTLGHYGVGYGPYMQLPFYGSFTLREDGGDMADTLYPVLSVVDLANVHRKMDYRRDRNPRAVAGLRWFAAPVFRSLYYGARGVLPAS
ncbi:VacJ lipoprotein [Salmonella enterica]|uniref:VacJ lipoprotein n=1 Tax=Salmonella sp. NCTC 6947 TaxID=2583581 RepID=A0A509BTY3_9ENTR|nr:VacJ lipoprotein [Salmonella enterica]